MLKVHWATDITGAGNTYGFSVHDRKSREALAAQPDVELSEDAKVELHVGPPYGFFPEGKDRRVGLYTAWESLTMPEVYIDGLRKADFIIVPATFLIEVVQKYVDVPVYYCPLGVDVKRFCPPPTRRDPRKSGFFMWLWVGAPNIRKGWDVIRATFTAFEDSGRGAVIYLKTSSKREDGGIDRFQIKNGPVVIVDGRNLPMNELVALYQNAHGFLFPTMGEGFGLTLAEAMATDLPCAYTPWSACTDLADPSCAYPLKYSTSEMELAPNIEDIPEKHKYTVDGVMAKADAESLFFTMLKIMSGYGEARKRGKRAGNRIRKLFTWENTGKTLRNILAKENAKWQSRVPVSA